LIGHFISELTVLCQNISSKVIVSVLAVKKKEICESFRKERWILKEKVEFFE
jgi:hypothetical protein